MQNWTYRFHPYTASSLHTQAIYRFQVQHDRPFSRASTCFRWEGVDNWWVNCEFMCYLAVPVAFALLLGEMDTQYLSKIWTKAYNGLYIYIRISIIIYHIYIYCAEVAHFKTLDMLMNLQEYCGDWFPEVILCLVMMNSGFETHFRPIWQQRQYSFSECVSPPGWLL